ncbi:MAG: YwqG family protein [Desulfitobacterium sp.]
MFWQDIRNVISQSFNKRGLSLIKEKLHSLMFNSIKLSLKEAEDEQIQIGESKMGGVPDLPAEVSWPMWRGIPLAFICQINLNEFRPFDEEKLLPSEGMLYFFYEANEQPWGFDPLDKGSTRVIYYSGDTSALFRVTLPDNLPAESRFGACKISFIREVTMPSWESQYIERLGLTKKELDIYSDYQIKVQEEVEEVRINRLLGHSDNIQGDMQLECQLVTNGLYCGDETGYNDERRKVLETNAVNWRLLLQIDSNEEIGMYWGDLGRIYFWIREDDLKKKNFDNVWTILQCG